jgi:hypothetical protein
MPPRLVRIDRAAAGVRARRAAEVELITRARYDDHPNLGITIKHLPDPGHLGVLDKKVVWLARVKTHLHVRNRIPNLH